MSKHQIGYIIFALFCLVCVAGIIWENWSPFVLLTGFVIWGAIVVWGSFSIQLNYHIKAISHIKTTLPVVSLTFDDGPTTYTNKVLDLLEKFNCKATFFCIGKNIENHPDIMNRMLKGGHLIGNHTYNHSNQNGFKGQKKIAQEIKKTDSLIEKITDKKPLYFRPPFGVTNPSIMRAIQRTKHTVIGWNIRSIDTVLKKENQIYNRIIRRFCPGSIILMHDTSAQSIRVLERLLIYMKKHNFKSITVEELINFKT